MLLMPRQHPGAGRPAAAPAPFNAVVELADDTRYAHAFLPVVELFLDLVLDDLALLLHHQYLFQAFGKAARALRLERPGKRDLVDPQADVARHALIDAEVGERAHHIAIRFAGGDDAETGARRVPDQPVEAVWARIGERGGGLVITGGRLPAPGAAAAAGARAAR